MLVAIRTGRLLLTVVWAAAVVALIGLGLLSRFATTFVISGGSMEPAIPLGSLIVVEPVSPAAIQVGDVITVRTDRGTVITHRVTRRVVLDGDSYFEIKGDANDTPDPGLVPVRSIVGRVGAHGAWLGYFTSMVGTPFGLISVLAMLASAMLLIWLAEDVEQDLAAGGGRQAGARERSGGEITA